MDIKNSTDGKKGKKIGKLVVIILAAIIFLGAIGAAGYFYTQNKKITQNPDAVAQAETAKLVATVGKLITLPTDETPSVATVTDKSKLADQPFFAKSENGDKVLIYTNAKKAILFRPSTDKIIEVMPISFTDTKATTPATTPTPTPETPKK